MLELFRLEAESQTAVLSAGVLAIEELERSPETVESMMRAAHSLKGAARIVGLDPAVRVAHALEDVFVGAGKGTFRVKPEHADRILAGIDFLSAIAKSDDALSPASEWPSRAERLVDDLGTMVADQAAVQTQVPAPEPAKTPPGMPGGTSAADAVAAPATAAKPADTPAPATRPAEQADRVVRVSADSLTRLVGLAGESLVETRQLRPFVDSLLQLRASEVDICDAIAALDEKLKAGDIAVPGTITAMLTTIRERSDAALAALTRHVEDFESFARRNEDLSNRLHHEVIVSRMRPLADGIRGFPRLVRDVARTLGKQVRFEVRGEQTGVDRDILDKLEAPLST